MQPVYISSVLSVSPEGGDFRVYETYDYDSHGLLTDYRAISEAYGEIQHFEYYYDDEKLVKKVETAKLSDVRRETYYRHGHEIEYNNISGKMRLYSDTRCTTIRNQLKFCEWESITRNGGLTNRAVEYQDQRVQQIATGSGSFSTSRSLSLIWLSASSVTA